MAFIPVSNGVEVEVIHSYGAERIENTLWYHANADMDVGDLNAFCLAFGISWAANVMPLKSTGVEMVQVKATNMNTETSPVGFYTPASPVAGSVASPALPSSVTWAVQFKTAGRGRSARGRNYWIGLTESQVSGNLIDAEHASAIIGAYNDLYSDIASEIDFWAVCSRFSGGAPRVAGILQPITAVTYADLVIDNQRRRLTGRGS